MFGYRAALVLSVIAGLITAAIAFHMEEVNLYKEQFQEQHVKMHAETLKRAFTFLLGCKEVLLITLLTVFAITTAGELDEYDQLIAKDFGLTMELIGIWTAIRFILISLGSFCASRIRICLEKLFPVKKGFLSLEFLCLLAAILLIISGAVKHIGVMGLYGLYYFLMSAGEVLQEDYIQQRIETEGRATIHSLVSLSKNLSGILFFGIYGLVITKTSLHTGLIVTGIYIILWIAVTGGFYRLSMQRQS